VQVYRDQLAEIDRDLARGVVSADEAERVRIEVSRRLLEADKNAQSSGAAHPVPATFAGIGAAVVMLVVIGVGAGLYASIGVPGYADLPLKERIRTADEAHENRPGQAEMEARQNRPFAPDPTTPAATLDLIEKLRTAVAENPDELQGYVFLAQAEAQLGNFKAAHPAQAKLIALKGDSVTPGDHITHAVLMILATQEYVSPEAEAALNAALELDPRNGWARFYLGQMHAQSGRPDLGYRIWRPLLAESRPEAPWYRPILAEIEGVAQAAGIRFTPPRPRADLSGPSAEDMEAAAEMTAEDRMEMIRGMVEGLSERLADEGGAPEEWARLINALGVLGETERAGAIWTEAQTVFADLPEALAVVRASAQRAGVAQ